MTYVHVAHDCRSATTSSSPTRPRSPATSRSQDRADHQRAHRHPPVRHHRRVLVHRRRIAGQPGHAAVHQGRRQPDRAVRAQHDRPAARRLRRRGGRRRSSARTASCFNSDLSVGRAIARAREEVAPLPEVERFLAFVESSRARSPRVIPALPIGVDRCGRARPSSRAPPRGHRPRPRWWGCTTPTACGRARWPRRAAAAPSTTWMNCLSWCGPSPSRCRRRSMPKSDCGCLRRGIPMLMEKPLATTLRRGRCPDRRGRRAGRAAAGGTHRAVQPGASRRGAAAAPSAVPREPAPGARSSPAAPTSPWCSTS